MDANNIHHPAVRTEYKEAGVPCPSLQLLRMGMDVTSHTTYSTSPITGEQQTSSLQWATLPAPQPGSPPSTRAPEPLAPPSSCTSSASRSFSINPPGSCSEPWHLARRSSSICWRSTFSLKEQFSGEANPSQCHCTNFHKSIQTESPYHNVNI